jgi:hypothetical protein
MRRVLFSGPKIQVTRYALIGTMRSHYCNNPNTTTLLGVPT